MSHTYATVQEADEYTTDGGGAAFASQSAAQVALKLSVLESVSRRVESASHRYQFGGGFGPRIGTNYYDGDGSNTLLLGDDLQSLSAFTVATATGNAGVSPVVTTDYFLANPDGYTGPPWRKIILHQRGTPTIYGPGYRTVVCTGTWGQSNVTAPTGTTVASGLAADAAATSFTTSASPLLYPGMTLLIGTEQLYVSYITGTTCTVVRGCNGTTAAVHADASTIARYVYDARVHEVTMRLYKGRMRARTAGADGLDGTLDASGILPREGEDTIIRRGLGDLLLLGQY